MDLAKRRAPLCGDRDDPTRRDARDRERDRLLSRRCSFERFFLVRVDGVGVQQRRVFRRLCDRAERLHDDDSLSDDKGGGGALKYYKRENGVVGPAFEKTGVNSAREVVKTMGKHLIPAVLRYKTLNKEKEEKREKERKSFNKR